MSKNLTGAICGAIITVCAMACAFCYILCESNQPWWLIVFAGVIISTILAMFGNYSRAENPTKKHKALISMICSSICLIAVFAFLAVMFLTSMEHSWIIAVIGGVASAIIYSIDNAIRKDKNEKQKSE